MRGKFGEPVIEEGQRDGRDSCWLVRQYSRDSADLSSGSELELKSEEKGEQYCDDDLD